MRTRLIRPEFFADTKLADLEDACRLFYVGLWCLADDDGYFEWDLRAVGAELYRYRDDARRHEETKIWMEKLLELGRVEELPCGRHGLIPTLTDHRMKGGRPTSPVRDKHERTCLHVQSRPATDAHVPGSGSGSGLGSGSESLGKGSQPESRASAVDSVPVDEPKNVRGFRRPLETAR